MNDHAARSALRLLHDPLADLAALWHVFQRDACAASDLLQEGIANCLEAALPRDRRLVGAPCGALCAVSLEDLGFVADGH